MSKESAIFKNATRVHVTEINGSNKLRVVNRRDIVNRAIREINEFLELKKAEQQMLKEQKERLKLIEKAVIVARRIELEVGYKPKYKPFKKVKPQQLHDKNKQESKERPNTKPASIDSRSESRHKANQLSIKNKSKEQ